MFNPDEFMNAVLYEANSTSFPLCPPGEYVGTITEANIESGTISKGDRAGQPWVRLNVQIETDDLNALVGTQLPKRRLRAGIMLDITESGNLDMSDDRNLLLGRLRKAVGLNNKGEPFSVAMLPGRSVRFVVSHRVDRDDASKFYEDVKAFRPV